MDEMIISNCLLLSFLTLIQGKNGKKVDLSSENFGTQKCSLKSQPYELILIDFLSRACTLFSNKKVLQLRGWGYGVYIVAINVSAGRNLTTLRIPPTYRKLLVQFRHGI